jgi:hypothetical protein
MAGLLELGSGGNDGGMVNLKTEMAEGESAAVIGPTRLPASRVASPFRCNRCEPESLVEPSTTPSSSLSIPVSRVNLPDLLGWDGRGDGVGRLCEVVVASHLFGTEDEVWKLFLQPFVEAGES